MSLLSLEDGTEVYYTDTGGDGPVLFLHHAFFCHEGMWSGVRDILADRYRVVTCDSRGHGQTVDNGEPYDTWDLAWDGWAVLDALGIERAFLGGVCQGANTALRMATQAADRALGLVLMGTIADQWSGKWLPIMEGTLRQWAELEGEAFYYFARGVSKSLIAGDEVARDYWINYWVSDSKPRLKLAGDAMMGRSSLVDIMSERLRDVPAVVLRGELDTGVNHEDILGLIAALPHPAELHTIPGAAMYANVTHPETVADLIDSFVASLSTTA